METTPPELDELAHHDEPRTPLPDRQHDMLQRQIDALLTHARTVTHQISDIVHRQQRIDSQMTNADARIADLQKEFRQHTQENADRHARFGQQIAVIERGQDALLRAVTQNAEVTVQIKDALTAGRVLGSLLRGTSGIVIAIGAIGGAVWALVKLAASYTR